MTFEKMKCNYFYIVLSVFLISNAFFISQPSLLKKIILSFILLLSIISAFFNKERVKKVMEYFVYLNNDDAVKKLSGGVSLFSWFLLTTSLFLLNMDFIWLARWLFLLFIIAVIINGVFVVYDLWNTNDVILNKFKPFFFGTVPILYFITSAYAASNFLQISNMDISASPLLELGWRAAFFAILFFILLQPVSYFFFLYATNKFKDHKVMSSVNILLLSSFLSLAVLHWANNFIVLSLDWATNTEWRTNATCGSLNITNSAERYFGFNTDKYTVYFSNRDGKWGFEELNCIKNDKNQDLLKRITISQSTMPKWFKE